MRVVRTAAEPTRAPPGSAMAASSGYPVPLGNMGHGETEPQQAAYIAYGWPTSGGEHCPADAGGWGGAA
jgi:hypothetical protein